MNELIPTHLRMSRFVARALVAATLAVTLAACAGSPGGQESLAERALVAPGKYVLYNCPQLAVAAKASEKRKADLEVLIARAGPGTGGRLAANVAYGPEYSQARGELAELGRAAAEKKCKPVPETPAAKPTAKQAAKPAAR
jgi:hypothetical protein